MISHNLLIAVKKKAQGFTLIETLVAVLLLVSAIAGPLTLASKGLSAAIVARDQMIAFYLAQDAIEYVRFLRDNNKLTNSSWLNGLASCTGSDGCTIAPTTGVVSACSGPCAPLNKYTTGTQTTYTYSQGTQTPQNFVRTIKLEAPSTGELTEEVLTVVVSWRAQSGLTRSVTVRENIFNWQ